MPYLKKNGKFFLKLNYLFYEDGKLFTLELLWLILTAIPPWLFP